MNSTEQIAANVAKVQERISSAARRVGREPAEIQLVAVTKKRSLDELADVVAVGVTDLGENRASELADKASQTSTVIPSAIRWHMIGQCQTNKVSHIAQYVSLWQSVDRLALINAIARHAPGARILVQVDTSGDPNRGGAAIGHVPAVIEEARTQGLDVCGLMAIAPLAEDPRECFSTVAALAKRLSLPECSIGMSDDFEIAIECGATMVRVGSSIFS